MALGVRIKNVPMVVATPLPPLNFKKGENRCPNTLKNATPAYNSGVSLKLREVKF